MASLSGTPVPLEEVQKSLSGTPVPVEDVQATESSPVHDAATFMVDNMSMIYNGPKLVKQVSRLVDTAQRIYKGTPVNPSDVKSAGIGPGGVGRPQGFLSAFASGVKRAGYNELGNLRSAVGVVESLFNKTEGDRMVDLGIATSNRGAQQNPRAFNRLEDVNSIGDLGAFTGDTLGEGLTQLGTSLAAGGVGGMVGKAVARRVAAEGVKKALLTRAAEAATLGKTVAEETGGTAQEQKQATGEVHPFVSMAAGLGKGYLEAILPHVMGHAAGLNLAEQKGLAAKLAKLMEGSTRMRIAKAAGGGALIEGGTEAAQEAIDIFARGLTDKEYNVFSSDAGSRLLNSAVSGAMVGAPVTGAFSGMTGKVAKAENIPEGELPPLGDAANVPQARTGPDLTTHIQPLETALTAEQQHVANIGTTLTDLQKGLTPGSKPEHEALGFTTLPEGFRGLPATTTREVQTAPLEVAGRDLAAIGQELKTASMEHEDPKVKLMAKQQLSVVNANRGYIVSAAFNKDSQGVPTAILTNGDADPIASTPQHLESVNYDMLPSGYKVSYYHGPDALQLQRLDGTPIFNFPNDVTYNSTLTHLMRADNKLQQGGFYQVAAGNLSRLHALQGTIDLQHVDSLGSKGEKVDYYRKAVGEASKLEPFKAKARPAVGLGAGMMEAGRVKFNQFMRQAYTILQWKQSNPELTPLSNYVDLLQTGKGDTMKTLSRADEILKRYMSLGKEQQDAAHDFADAMWRQTYRTQKEREDKVSRMPTPAEERALIQGKGRKNKTPLLRETYQAIKDMQQMGDDKFRSYIDYVARELQYIADPKTRLAQFKGLQAASEKYFSKPRFPFTSVGDFIVTVKDKEGKLVTARQSESPIDQKADFVELSKKYDNPEAYTIAQSRLPQNAQKWTALPSAVIRDLRRRGYMPGMKKEQLDLLELLANTGPETRKRFINGMNPRKRSVDLQRAFALWAQNLANAEFAFKSIPNMQREVKALDAIRQSAGGENTNKLGLLITGLNEHLDELLNPTADWSPMKNFAFMYHIAFNAKSALVNSTQVPLVTLPYLSSRFGDLKAGAALLKAYADKRSISSNGKVEKLTDPLSKLLTKGIQDGKVDESFATELASLSEGTNLNRMLAGSKYDRFMKEVSYYGSYLFAGVEKLNRSVTFRAAAQLALDNPNSKWLADLARQQPLAMERLQREGFSLEEAKAYLAGVDTIDRTMFEYAKWNRPKAIRGGLKGSLGTFMMFTQGMLHFAVHSPGAARYWLLMLGTAGLLGLPGADDADELIHALAQRFFGKDFDPKVEARKLIRTTVDPFIRTHFNAGHKTAADLLLHGISHDSFGLSAAADAMGVPWVPNVDVSNSISMGRILPLGPELLKPGVDFNKALAKTTEKASGAAFGPIFAIIEALRSEDADFKRWEQAMPAAMRGFLRAGRYEQEGRERDSSGSTVLDFNPMDPGNKAEIIATALGFQSTRLSKKWDELTAQRDASNFWDTRRAMLLSQLDYAIRMKDPEGKQDMLAAVKRYNKGLPEEMKLKRITSKTISESMKARAKHRANPLAKSDKPAAVYYKRLYQGTPE